MESGKFGVWSLEFGVWSLEFGVWNLEFGVWSLEFGVKRGAGLEDIPGFEEVQNNQGNPDNPINHGSDM